MNTGFTDATVYFFSLEVKSFLVNADKEEALDGFTEIKTFPYSGGT